MAHVYDHASEARRAPGLGNVCKVVQQLGIVGCVVGVLARISGTVDAGRALQHIHLKAGVVGQCGQAGLQGGVSRLDDRIFHEGGTGFGNLGHVIFRLPNEMKTLRVKNRLYFPCLGDIITRKDYFFGHLYTEAGFLPLDDLSYSGVCQFQQGR